MLFIYGNAQLEQMIGRAGAICSFPVLMGTGRDSKKDQTKAKLHNLLTRTVLNLFANVRTFVVSSLPPR